MVPPSRDKVTEVLLLVMMQLVDLLFLHALTSLDPRSSEDTGLETTSPKMLKFMVP